MEVSQLLLFHCWSDALSQRGPTTFDLRAILQKRDN